MAEPKGETQKAAAAETTEAGLLDQIVQRGRFVDAPAKERGRDMIKQFVAEVLAGTITLGRDTDTMLNARIAQIDRLISLQVNEVL
ncbi:MAG TPA: type VI secretion system contractile sheath large subunit, partial [Gemmatimonadales bacterium]|nr:type VI secretion system contractile sheath large subunit [Gemmatimonadales bacterium]